MKPTAVILLTCTLALCSSPVMGAEHLTLPQAIERATIRHPLVRAAEAGAEAARAREAQARALQNPALSLQANEMPLANPANGNLMAGVSVPLPVGRARAARAEIARLEAAMADSEIQQQRRDLIATVKTAFAEVVHRAETVRLTRVVLHAAERLLKAAEARYQSGDVPRIEVFRAEVERNRAQRDVRVAESQLSLVKRRLGLLVDHDPAEELMVANLPVPTASQLPPIRDLQERMTAVRPEHRRAELEVQAAARQRDVARATIWQGTEVSFAGGLAEGQPAVSTALTLPLPFYRHQAEISETEAQLRRAEARLEALRLQLRADLDAAYQSAAIAWTRYQLVTASDLPQARRFADNARRRFTIGEGSGLEAVEALRTLREIETEQLSALLEYRTALARLEQTVGSDLPQ